MRVAEKTPQVAFVLSAPYLLCCWTHNTKPCSPAQSEQGKADCLNAGLGTLLSLELSWAFFLVFEGRPLTLDTKHQPTPHLVMRKARESLTQTERQIRQPQMSDYHTELNSKASPDFQGPDWSNPDLPFSSLPRITEAQRLISPQLGGSLECLSPPF